MIPASGWSGEQVDGTGGFCLVWHVGGWYTHVRRRTGTDRLCNDAVEGYNMDDGTNPRLFIEREAICGLHIPA